MGCKPQESSGVTESGEQIHVCTEHKMDFGASVLINSQQKQNKIRVIRQGDLQNL